MWDSQAVPAVAVTYADAYAKASVTDNLCDFSFGTTSSTGAAGVTPAVSPMPTVFGNGNGVPPTNGINLVFNSGRGRGGPPAGDRRRQLRGCLLPAHAVDERYADQQRRGHSRECESAWQTHHHRAGPR